MQIPHNRKPIRLGRYELLQKLATGGMAEIYVARQEGPHGFSKRIALKRILPQLAADSDFVAMFIDEARLCAQLTHPNLVQVFDFGEEGGELYMAMELVEGTTGAKVIRAAAKLGEPVPTEVALHIALSVGRGLAHAHEACSEAGEPLGLVHRDVSPGNILISATGAVKLADFGIARAAEFERRTEQGQLKGKLGYMSPEQVVGRELDAKSDQFTAAIVLAELLTARPLFAGQRELDVLVKIRDADVSVLEREGRHIPTDLMAVLRRALSRRREDRFHTTSEYVDALDEVDRTGRLGVGPAPLVEWLHRVELVKSPSRSGKHAVAVTAKPDEPPTTRPSGDAQRPAQSIDAIMRDPTVVWTIVPGELPRWFFDLALARTTGLVVLQNGGVQKKVFLVDGVPVVTLSTDHKELLGAMLLERGLVLPKDIEMALEIAPRVGGRLGDALVRLGVLRPMELVRAVVDQMKRRFIEVIGWKRGLVSFASDARCRDEETVPEAFNPFELIARGISLGYTNEDLSAILAPVERAVLVPLPRAPVSMAWLKLDAPELSVLSSVQAQQTLADVRTDAAARGIGPDHVLRAVFIGLSSGVLVSPAWRPAVYRESLPTLHDG